MDSHSKEMGATDVMKTAMKLVSLTRRILSVSAKSQSRALDQASGAEFSLMDTSTLANAYMNVWSDLLTNPSKMMEAQMKIGESMTRSWPSFFEPRDTQDDQAKADRRFADATWSEDPTSRFYRYTYLMFENTMGAFLDQLEQGTQDELRVKFYTRQALSALSPSNFLVTNAAAQQELQETNGQSLIEGLENLLDDLERGDGRLDITTNDAEAFVVGRDLATTEGEVVL